MRATVYAEKSQFRVPAVSPEEIAEVALIDNREPRYNHQARQSQISHRKRFDSPAYMSSRSALHIQCALGSNEKEAK